MTAINVFRGTSAQKVRVRFGMVPTSEALHLLPASATGTEWADARRRLVGASELPTILGTPGAYGSPFALWWGKTQGWDDPGSEEMAMGRALEPVIADVWQQGHQETLLLRPGAALYGHPVYSWLACTPDYLAVRVEPGPMVQEDRGAGLTEWVQTEPDRVVVEPVECKAYDGGGWGKPGTDEVPDHIEVQVRVQCAILGARRGHVARMKGKRITYYTIDCADGLPAEWLHQGRRFWESLSGDVPPPLDGLKATEEALTRIYSDMDPEAVVNFTLAEVLEYQLAMRAVREAQDRKQKAVNAIRDRLGTAKTGHAPGGVAFVERRVYKRAAYEVAAGVVDALYPKGNHDATA